MTDKFRMDSHKLLWHIDRLQEWKKGKKIAPLHIDLGITTGCNMACSYCYGVLQGRTNENHRFDMPAESLIRLIQDAKDVGVRSIAFIGEGENTLNLALYDGLMCAKEVGIDVSLATNGIAINADHIPLMLSSLKWIRFNISAATPESYFKIHRVMCFDTVCRNIEACIQERNKLKSETTIGLQMVLTHDNVDDIVPLAKLGVNLGVDYLVIKPCSDSPEKSLNAPTHEYLDMEPLLTEAESYGTDSYSVIIKWQKMKNLGIKQFKKCFGTQFIIGISGDGTVFPCGHFFNIQRENYEMGNIIKNSFKEIVESDRYWDVQKRISRVNVNTDCETNCRQYYVSSFLESLQEVPAHVNFI